MVMIPVSSSHAPAASPSPPHPTQVSRTHESITGSYLLTTSLSFTTISGNIDITLLFSPSASPKSSDFSPPCSLTVNTTSGNIKIRTHNIAQHPLLKSRANLLTSISTISGYINAALHHGTSTTLSTISGGVRADLHPLRPSSPTDPSYVNIQSTSGPIYYTLHPCPLLLPTNFEEKENEEGMGWINSELHNVSDNISVTVDTSWRGNISADVVSGRIERWGWKSIDIISSSRDGKTLRGHESGAPLPSKDTPNPSHQSDGKIRESERKEFRRLSLKRHKTPAKPEYNDSEKNSGPSYTGAGGKITAQTTSATISLSRHHCRQDRTWQYFDPRLHSFGIKGLRKPGEFEEFVPTVLDTSAAGSSSADDTSALPSQPPEEAGGRQQGLHAARFAPPSPNLPPDAHPLTRSGDGRDGREGQEGREEVRWVEQVIAGREANVEMRNAAAVGRGGGEVDAPPPYTG